MQQYTNATKLSSELRKSKNWINDDIKGRIIKYLKDNIKSIPNKYYKKYQKLISNNDGINITFEPPEDEEKPDNQKAQQPAPQPAPQLAQQPAQQPAQ